MSALIERSPILEIKFAPLAAKDTGEIAGIAAAFGNVDVMGDIVTAGAFATSLAEHKSAGTLPAMLWAHNPSEPVGRWIELRETPRGLEVRGRLSDVPRGRDAHTLAADGALGLSIGYKARQFDYDAAGHRLLHAVDLVEISLVSVPANSRAKITSVKSAYTPRDLETILRDAGVPKALAAGVITKGWRDANDDRREADDEAQKSIIATLAAATARLTKGN